jgi:cell division septal protein FtsQ
MRTTTQSKTQSTDFSASDLAARHSRPLQAPGERRRGLPQDVKERPQRSHREASPAPRAKEKRRKQSALSPQAKARIFRAVLLCLALFVAAGCVVAAYQAFVASGWFTLRRVDLQGVANVPREDLMRRVSPHVSASLWQIDLDAVRRDLERQPGVLKAEVVRVLPDTLRVTVEERKPVAPARRESGAVVWVDQEGVALGEQAQIKAERVPPVVSGLEEGDGQAAAENNRRRMEVYQRLVAELGQSGALLAEVDEANLGDWRSARLTLGQKRVAVIVGDEDFSARLRKALEVLENVSRGDFSGVLKPSDAERLAQGARIAYLNVTRPGSVIVGLAE